MREFIPGVLWIGNARDARNVEQVLALGISVVIDLAMEEAPVHYPRDVAYCRFPLIDGEGNSMTLLQTAIVTTASFIQDQVPTLVACSGGMSRAPAIVAAAMAQLEDTSPEEALERVTAKGPHDVSESLWAEVIDCAWGHECDDDCGEDHSE